ncbi:MAG: HAMP domain-containing sensor histidine kinase [Aromatoleum sp.]|jgi:signal transduction histidine kinase|uniref:sensor histidine kinase n=1 Tax=Aromatoleum sp. TaxID=2307007 RepID=UPI0028943603|nr:HAMP domain-containing sensor histidine kinase [Aromatoleum sp.]MDT3669692.1 HAMP domain-containing sensor histidine kinase [Aromatoleum sp.]
MLSRLSLADRIVAAFVLMAVAVAGLFSVSIILAVDGVELELVSDSMNRHLDFLIAERRAGRDPAPGPDMTLYVVPVAELSTLPTWLQGREPGLYEEVTDDDAYHVMIRDEDGRRHVLLLNQEDFERREQTRLHIVSFGFMLSIFVAWLLGKALARTVIAPVVRLSGQVQHRDQLLPLAPPLAPDYADDEVGKLAAAFDVTLGRLREALEREQLFTSDISHELRTPLMIIASSAELLLEHPSISDSQRRQIERITRACLEMQELVETFLGLARAPQEKQVPLAGTSLADAADEQLHRWQPEAARRGLELGLAVESGDDDVYPGPLLRAVLTNLLRNAIHYTDRGFVRLVIRAGGFSVVDSGAGIPEGERTKIFRPFARGEASRGDGIGIGLSIVARICERQGWAVRLEEPAGGGCEFRVDLHPV